MKFSVWNSVNVLKPICALSIRISVRSASVEIALKLHTMLNKMNPSAQYFLQW